MRKEMTLKELYSEIKGCGSDYLKVNVELHDGHDTEFIVDITVTDGGELDVIYATAEVNEDERAETTKIANEMANDLLERLENKYDNVKMNSWA